MSEPLTELLHRYAAALPVSLELLDPEPHRDALFTAIKKEREQLRESRRRSYDELARILNTFDTSFPDAIPNDSDDFDERVHDYVALCKHIDERELPEAYERMMRLVTEQAPDAILTLHRVAEQETRRISDQIDRVNTGLGAVEFNRGTRLTLRATPRQLPAVAELTEIVRSISRRIAEVGLGDKQAILDQYADILRLRNRLASTAPEDKAWTRDALDVRNRFTFDCAEWDVSSEELIRTHSNAGDNSGGEQEKLMAFCLAGALSFNLASPESADNTPVFAQLMLDEAFSQVRPAVRAAGAAGVPQVRLPAGDRGDGAERHHHPALHRQRGDGVQDRGHRPQRPPGRDGGHQDDLGVHLAAAGDAHGGKEGAGRRVSSPSRQRRLTGIAGLL